MGRIAQTKLPGVGFRYDIDTDSGQRIGVIHHHGGRRELFVCTAADPDTAALSLSLGEDEAHQLVDALGGSQVVENLGHLQTQVEGLAIDWLPVPGDSGYAGKTIGDARIRTRTGVSVVAIIRQDQHHPAPGPDFRIDAGDTLVVVGTAEGIEAVSGILSDG